MGKELAAARVGRALGGAARLVDGTTDAMLERGRLGAAR